MAQRWVLVGSVRGPRELRAHRGGAAAGELCFAKIGLSSGVVRIEVEVVVARIGAVRHASRTFGLHMGVGVMLRASRQSGQDHQEPLCELIPYISEFDRATELKKSERSGKIVQAHRKRVLYTAEEARAC